MWTRDFYTGFEGYPEYVWEHRVGTSVRARVRAWDGYFDVLVKRLRPEGGVWTGFLLHYHCCTALWDVDLIEWTDPDPVDTLAKLRTARATLEQQPAHRSPETVAELADTLGELVSGVVRDGGSLVWRVD